MSSKDDLMNGVAAAAPTPSAQPFQPHPQTLKLAEDTLAAVKSGQIVSLVCCTVSGLGAMHWPASGIHVTELILAAEFFRDDAKKMLREGGKSKIIRSGG